MAIIQNENVSSCPLTYVDPIGHGKKTALEDQPTSAELVLRKDSREANMVWEDHFDAVNCILWAMNGGFENGFGRHLGLGQQGYEDLMAADDCEFRMFHHLQMLFSRRGVNKVLENEACPQGTHKVGVFIRGYKWWRGGGRDVHMITLDAGGTWTGKPGWRKPVEPQTSSDVINEWGLERVKVVGFFCVPGKPRSNFVDQYNLHLSNCREQMRCPRYSTRKT